MKRLIFLLLIIAFASFTQAQSFENPLQYFEYLNQQHNELVNKNLEYVQHSVHTVDVQKVENKRLDVLKQLGKAIIQVGVLPAYEGDDVMRLDLMKVLKVYLESFEIEFSKINMLKLKSSESFEAMEEYLAAQDAAEKKLAKAADEYLLGQKAFAKRHNIILTEAESNSEVDQINRVNAYYRVVFMKYFKISKLNAAFMEALDEKDIEKMNKARKVLLSASEYELRKLQLFPDFKGNTGYRDATIAVVEFYKTLAANGYKKMVAFTATANEDRTQEGVDAFNNVIEVINTETNPLLVKYNEALNQLLKDNVPKPSIATQRL